MAGVKTPASGMPHPSVLVDATGAPLDLEVEWAVSQCGPQLYAARIDPKRLRVESLPVFRTCREAAAFRKAAASY